MATFSKLGNAVSDIKTEFNTTMLKVMTGDGTAFSKGDRIAMALGSIGGTLLGSVGIAYADGDIIAAAESALNQYYGRLVAIVTLIAAFFILCALIWIMVAPSGQGAQVPISWIKRIIICWILILAFNGIVVLIKNLTSGMQYNGN